MTSRSPTPAKRTTAPPSQLVLAIVFHEVLGLALLVDWLTDEPTWTSGALYAGLGVMTLGVAMYLARSWARIVGIILTSLLLVVMTVVFVLTATGFGSISAELEIAGRDLALPAHLMPWVCGFLSALFGWLVWVLARRSTRGYFRGVLN